MRIPATAATAVVGATVFTSRTGPVARTVVAVEGQPGHPDLPLVHARRFAQAPQAMVFALTELWVEATGQPHLFLQDTIRLTRCMVCGGGRTAKVHQAAR